MGKLAVSVKRRAALELKYLNWRKLYAIFKNFVTILMLKENLNIFYINSEVYFIVKQS